MKNATGSNGWLWAVALGFCAFAATRSDAYTGPQPSDIGGGARPTPVATSVAPQPPTDAILQGG